MNGHGYYYKCEEVGVVLRHIVLHYFIKKILFQVSILGPSPKALCQPCLYVFLSSQEDLAPRPGLWQLRTKYGGQGYCMSHFPPSTEARARQRETRPRCWVS